MTWPQVTLSEVAEVERRSVNPADLPPDTRYLGLEHIERGGRILSHDTVAKAGLTSNKFIFAPDHVLFGKLRPNLGKVARPAFDGVCSTDILPIKPGRSLDRNYLTHYLRQPAIIRYAASRASGANLPRLSPTALGSFTIPLPPLAEQQRIAAILDHADTLRTKRHQQLTHLDTLPQALFHHMFGDPDAASSTIELGEIATLSGGRNLVAGDPTLDSPFRVLKISAVTSGQFKPEESKPLPADYEPPPEHLVQVGDLLMSRANTTELVGAVALATSTPPNLALPDKVWRFNWKTEADPVFYHALLSTPTIRRRISRLASGTGGSMKNVSKAKLLKMPIPVASITLQRKFVKQAQQVSQHSEILRQANLAGDRLFTSIQSQAFKGEI
ncbi:MAG: restriction endonuclease subunit S [Aeromicrobium sp.]|uniref:restriction endonuclease subunit S n=1 Tax=Aeromicrobium sp. TaxID=1871063 RepID=UPI0039E2C093